MSHISRNAKGGLSGTQATSSAEDTSVLLMFASPQTSPSLTSLMLILVVVSMRNLGNAKSKELMGLLNRNYIFRISVFFLFNVLSTSLD